MNNPFDTSTFDHNEGQDPFPEAETSLTGHSLSEARLCSVQAIYQVLLCEEAWGAVKNSFLAGEVKKRKARKALFSELVDDVAANHARYIELINAHIGENWDPARLPLVEKSLLLCAVAELYSKPETDTKVILNEYINLTKGFFDDKKAGFVNGILDAIARKVRDAAPTEAEEAADI